MADNESPPKVKDDTAILQLLLQGTASETGRDFFRALVTNLATSLGVHGAWATEYLPEKNQLSALALWIGGKIVDDYVYQIKNTPCEAVIDRKTLVHFPDRLIELFPNDPDLPVFTAVSYMGIPLIDHDDTILGHLAILDTKTMAANPRIEAVFRVFADRAAAELRRLRVEQTLREREEKLSRLVNGAMDAIVELDDNLAITNLNAAAEKLFAESLATARGTSFARFLGDDCRIKLINLIGELKTRPEGERYLWVPGGFRARPADGEEFPAEATLSGQQTNNRWFHTLILRDVNDRLAAEAKIQALTEQAEYLKEEIRALHGFDEVIGRSPALMQTLRDVEQVAPTDASVLIMGETGTGKEVIARAIHNASNRADKPLVRVNCAAIPANLIESEFFGHEAGAFTGATKRREGRFALANGGTIFLDEIGELPLDLQSKLLRVLQEGEFEPVGSSQTQKIDVRVLAATNRDLKQAVADGLFREDLYYRLNVFPLELPPLRDRDDDIVLLAEAFVARAALRQGRIPPSLTADTIARLKAYAWPGNVRELQNVIERAVITSPGDQLRLGRALPEGSPDTPVEPTVASTNIIRTAEEMDRLERDNIIRALEACNWQVSGQSGAAALLGMKPTTLSSRIKSLRIHRPR